MVSRAARLLPALLAVPAAAQGQPPVIAPPPELPELAPAPPPELPELPGGAGGQVDTAPGLGLPDTEAPPDTEALPDTETLPDTEALPDGALPGPASAAEPGAIASYHADLWELVVIAHPVVQAVMALLALAAFVTLTILVYKTVEITLSARRLARAGAALLAAPTLEPARPLSGPAQAMLAAATHELRLAADDPALCPGTRERTRATLARIEAGAALDLRGGTSLLASIGALAPFIGLFGTVFGIMNSFLAIAQTQTTNLAVVAPGIAEALLATAIGLAAAIPAVMIYNHLNRRIATFRHRLADFAVAVETRQSRALDLLSAPHPAPHPAPNPALAAE